MSRTVADRPTLDDELLLLLLSKKSRMSGTSQRLLTPLAPMFDDKNDAIFSHCLRRRRRVRCLERGNFRVDQPGTNSTGFQSML